MRDDIHHLRYDHALRVGAPSWGGGGRCPQDQIGCGSCSEAVRWRAMRAGSGWV